MKQRLVSLLPSLTEVLYLLGLGDQVVGITHECDYPSGVEAKTVVTTSALAHGLTSLQIEEQVLAQTQQQQALYGLNIPALQALQPDIIFTQSLCDVCAVSEPLVQAVAQQLRPVPKVVTCGPTNLAEILASITLIGDATGRQAEAEAFLTQARQRLAEIQNQIGTRSQPRIFCLEWLEPLYAGGHWVPEMVTFAGGTAWNVGGEPSRRVTWQELVTFAPEVLVILPCGFGIERALAEMSLLTAHPLWSTLPAVQQQRVYVADGNSYFSRPGPRVIEGIAVLAEILHPDVFAGLAPADSYVHYTHDRVAQLS